MSTDPVVDPDSHSDFLDNSDLKDTQNHQEGDNFLAAKAGVPVEVPAVHTDSEEQDYYIVVADSFDDIEDTQNLMGLGSFVNFEMVELEMHWVAVDKPQKDFGIQIAEAYQA